MKLNVKIIGGAVVTLAAIYYWLVIRASTAKLDELPAFISICYWFTFRMFRFADVLWTIAGATLLYRGIDQARAA